MHWHGNLLVSYERLWPTFNGSVLNGTAAEPYTNPGAAVHVVTGAAGKCEILCEIRMTSEEHKGVELATSVQRLSIQVLLS